MTLTEPGVAARSPVRSGRPAPRRWWRGRLSTGHIVVAVAGLLAALANFAVLRAASGTTTVLAASTAIPAGADLGPAMVEPVELGVGDAEPGQFVRPDSLTSANAGERVAAVTIPEGALLRTADLRDAAATEPGWRRMAVPLARERAVGGALQPEDRIDLIAVTDGQPAYLVSGARVLAVSEAGSGGLSVGGDVTITIAVGADTALCVAEALARGELTAVLSTGQEPVATTSCRAAGGDGDAGASPEVAPATTGEAVADGAGRSEAAPAPAADTEVAP